MHIHQSLFRPPIIHKKPQAEGGCKLLMVFVHFTLKGYSIEGHLQGDEFLGCHDRVSHQHGHGHWSNTSRNRCYETSLFHTTCKGVYNGNILKAETKYRFGSSAMKPKHLQSYKAPAGHKSLPITTFIKRR